MIAFSKSFEDTSGFFISFNKWLDVLKGAQVSRDEVLVFSSMFAERNQVNKNLREGEKMIRQWKPPYEIEWNQYEKIRMLSDEDLRKTNHKLTQELSRDTGILMGYQITSRMTWQ